MRYREEIKKAQNIMLILECIQKTTDSKKLFSDSLRLSEFFEYFLNKLKNIFENNDQYTKNVAYPINLYSNSNSNSNPKSYSNKNTITMHSYTKICEYLSKYIIKDKNIIKYFVEVICSE